MCSVVSNSLCPLWTLTCQAPLSMEFSRQEYWSGCHFLPHFFTQMYIRVGGSAVAKTTSSTITPSTLLFPVQLSEINWKVLYLIKKKKSLNHDQIILDCKRRNQPVRKSCSAFFHPNSTGTTLEKVVHFI